MPAAAEFLTHGGVLGAADGGHGEVARDADVAPDALPDVLEVAGLDLAGQERVGDGWAGRADQIEHAGLDLVHHHVRRGETAHAHNGFGGQLLESADIGLLLGLGAEA